MAPPLAPTPHRFLTDTPRRGSSHESEVGIKGHPVRRRPAFAPASPAPSTPGQGTATPIADRGKQFAATPKFLATSTYAQASEASQRDRQGAPNHAAITPTVQPHQSEILFDVIDEASQDASDEDGEALENYPSVEGEGTLFDDFETENIWHEKADTSPASKRMKYCNNAITTGVSSAQVSTAFSEGARKARRFLHSDPQSAGEPGHQEPILISKAHAFLRSSSPVEAQADTDPLPLQFSPHRKGQKFEPGGLAATLRSHIMDMTSSSSHQLTRGKERWTIQVCEIQTALPFFQLRGTTKEGNDGHFILAGPGTRATPNCGDVIQVQGLTWTVDLASQEWIVCIDWKTV